MSNPRPLPSQRILVVDDEPGVRSAIKLLLAFDGHKVEVVAGGVEALDRFVPDNFDLVITDFCMPGMTGGELAAALKERSPRVPIILLTAYPPAVLPPGVDLLLTKPFLLDSLREALATVCAPRAV